MNFSLPITVATLLFAVFFVANASLERVGRERCAQRFDDQTCFHALNR